MTLKVTSGGTDRGAEPIFEGHGCEAWNWRFEGGIWNMGIKTEGIE